MIFILHVISTTTSRAFSRYGVSSWSGTWTPKPPSIPWTPVRLAGCPGRELWKFRWKICRKHQQLDGLANGELILDGLANGELIHVDSFPFLDVFFFSEWKMQNMIKNDDQTQQKMNRFVSGLDFLLAIDHENDGSIFSHKDNFGDNEVFTNRHHEVESGLNRLVGGLEHQFYFSQKYWVSNHPNWRTHIFQRRGETTNQ